MRGHLTRIGELETEILIKDQRIDSVTTAMAPQSRIIYDLEQRVARLQAENADTNRRAVLATTELQQQLNTKELTIQQQSLTTQQQSQII